MVFCIHRKPKEYSHLWTSPNTLRQKLLLKVETPGVFFLFFAAGRTGCNRRLLSLLLWDAVKLALWLYLSPVVQTVAMPYEPACHLWGAGSFVEITCFVLSVSKGNQRKPKENHLFLDTPYEVFGSETGRILAQLQIGVIAGLDQDMR